MTSLANRILLPQLPVELPNLDLTDSELFRHQAERNMDQTFNVIAERYIDEAFNAIIDCFMDGNSKDLMEGDDPCSNGDHKCGDLDPGVEPWIRINEDRG